MYIIHKISFGSDASVELKSERGPSRVCGPHPSLRLSIQFITSNFEMFPKPFRYTGTLYMYITCHLHNVKVLRLAPRHKPLTTLAYIFRVSAKNNLI